MPKFRQLNQNECQMAQEMAEVITNAMIQHEFPLELAGPVLMRMSATYYANLLDTQPETFEEFLLNQYRLCLQDAKMHVHTSSHIGCGNA